MITGDPEIRTKAKTNRGICHRCNGNGAGGAPCDSRDSSELPTKVCPGVSGHQLSSPRAGTGRTSTARITEATSLTPPAKMFSPTMPVLAHTRFGSHSSWRGYNGTRSSSMTPNISRVESSHLSTALVIRNSPPNFIFCSSCASPLVFSIFNWLT